MNTTQTSDHIRVARLADILLAAPNVGKLHREIARKPFPDFLCGLGLRVIQLGAPARQRIENFSETLTAISERLARVQFISNQDYSEFFRSLLLIDKKIPDIIDPRLKKAANEFKEACLNCLRNSVIKGCQFADEKTLEVLLKACESRNDFGLQISAITFANIQRLNIYLALHKIVVLTQDPNLASILINTPLPKSRKGDAPDLAKNLAASLYTLRKIDIAGESGYFESHIAKILDATMNQPAGIAKHYSDLAAQTD